MSDHPPAPPSPVPSAVPVKLPPLKLPPKPVPAGAPAPPVPPKPPGGLSVPPKPSIPGTGQEKALSPAAGIPKTPSAPDSVAILPNAPKPPGAISLPPKPGASQVPVPPKGAVPKSLDTTEHTPVVPASNIAPVPFAQPASIAGEHHEPKDGVKPEPGGKPTPAPRPAITVSKLPEKVFEKSESPLKVPAEEEIVSVQGGIPMPLLAAAAVLSFAALAVQLWIFLS